ncbi:copper amine oxidase N-terminal domain-containing protein [Dysosmobacter sp.]
MKRIFSLVLALILALSLASTALAAEELSPPLWQEYGCDSRESCIQEWFGGSEEDYQSAVDERLERQRWEASMADEIAAFDADAYWNSGECWQAEYYDSKEAFMEDWLLANDEEFRATMLEDWLDSQWWEYYWSTQITRTRAELGGVEGQIGVMLDGTYISFPDAVPEVANGRTMVPCRQVLEAFGGTVSHEDGTVVCQLDGTALRFRDGSSTVSIKDADGTERTLEMDVPCYYKNGRTYIPVRFFAEALGCDVLWDSNYETAVLLRREALIQEMDADFTVLNRMLSAMVKDTSKNYKTVAKMDAKLTMLDSINGDKTYSMNADVEMLQSGTTVNLSAKMDLSALAKMSAATDGMSPLEAAAMSAALRSARLELIYDGENGQMYMQLPALSLLTYGMYADGSWIAMPTASMEELSQAGSAASVGALLYESQLSYSMYGDPALLCRDMRESARMLSAYLGDSCFRDSGGYSVLHYGEEEYKAAMANEYGEEYAEWANEFEQLDLELKVARAGSATFRVLLQNKDLGYGDVILVDASGSISPVQVDMKLLLKLKNQFNLDLRYTASTAPTQAQPAAAPPEGAVVIDPYEMEEVPALLA